MPLFSTRYTRLYSGGGQRNGQYADHSNWGPTDNADTVNPRGYPDLKPQVLAPGVNIRSSVNTGDSAYGGMSGTSMSAPHVAGLIALMWGAAPCLVGDYATTETLIELERALKAFRNLAEYIQTHPEAILQGKEKK